MKTYKLNKQIRDHEIYRDSFIELVEAVFGLSFRSWYENGFWTDRYIPYAMVDGDRVAANASVNIIDTVWRGEKKRYIQIGTVMTHPDYRRQGLMREIMENILADWKERCDGIYLYANDSVVDFYPKFGFEKAQEYGYRMEAVGAHTASQKGAEAAGVRPDGQKGAEASALSGAQSKTGSGALWTKLDMETREARELFKSFYQKSNPYSALPMVDNYGLLMFIAPIL